MVTSMRQVAEKFVARCKSLARVGALDPVWNNRDLAPMQTEPPFVFRWDEQRNLYEFALHDTISGAQSGFLILAEDRSLPPVMEYSLEGPPLSHVLKNWYGARSTSPGTQAGDVEFWYFNGFELAIRIYSSERTDDQFIRFPHGETIVRAKRASILRALPTTRARAIENSWLDLESNRLRGMTRGQRILWPQRPVPYNQLRRGNAIMGCTPVAWAMLASALRGASYKPGAARLWGGSNCWNIPWATSSQCADVENAIWYFHQKLGTGDDGGTSFGNIQRGEEAFKDLWGVDWDWEDDGNDDWGDVTGIVNDDNPFIFSAVGQWRSAIDGIVGDSRAAVSARRGGVGHSVVCYGYDDANHQIQVSYGWGTLKSDCMISFDQFGPNRVNYVDDFG